MMQRRTMGTNDDPTCARPLLPPLAASSSLPLCPYRATLRERSQPSQSTVLQPQLTT